ncbi:Nn.00g039770.m01.CDS01 [Neocucurbitaria sp. VM-36]
MVSLPDVRASNAQIPTALPGRLVAVFAGATSGIGETTIKTFVKYVVEPRIYLFARNATSAERVIAECREFNPRGEYVFVKVDLSLVKETDRACEEVKSREKLVNLVVLSAGELSFDRALTSEGLNSFLAASAYTRIRIIQQLLSLLIAASKTTSLARVIDVAGGTKEGDLDTSDLAALKIPFRSLRPHITSMHTLALETLAEQAPTVSFVHDFPGAVYSGLHKNVPGWLGFASHVVLETVYWTLGRWLFVPVEESGERHVFLATSERYKPKDGQARGLPLVLGLKDGTGSDGHVGSGVYSVDWDCEGPSKKGENALKGLRKKGAREVVWSHLTEQFEQASKSATN